MFRSKTTTVPICAILLILLPMVSGLPFKGVIAPFDLHAFRAVTNRLLLKQHLSADSGQRTTPATTQDPIDAGTLATTSCPANLTEVVRGCYRYYLQSYGLDIDSSGNLPRFFSYYDAVQNSSNSVESTCRSFNFLHDCIERRIPSPLMPHCMNEAALTSRYGDALAYSDSFAQLEYSCGQGFTVFKASQQCMANFSNSETVIAQFYGCLRSGQFADTDTCSNSVINARCINQLYGGACGTPCGHAMCEVQVNMARYQLKTGDSTCCERISAECSDNYDTTTFDILTTSSQQMTTNLQSSSPAP